MVAFVLAILGNANRVVVALAQALLVKRSQYRHGQRQCAGAAVGGVQAVKPSLTIDQ